jgi:Cytosolic domain of 10TM putative phosphate transporter
MAESPVLSKGTQLKAMSESLEAAIKDYNDKKEEYNSMERSIQEHKDNILNNKAKYFTGIAFVSFNKMKDKEKVLQRSVISAWRWIFLGCKYKLRFRSSKINESPLIRVQQAPEPAEVLWDNLKYNFKLQMKMKLLTVFVAGLILICSFIMIFGLKFASYKIKNKYRGDLISVTKTDGSVVEKYRDLTTAEEGQLQLISIVIFAIAKIVNKIIDAVVAKLAHFERMHTKSELYSSASNKIVMSQFLNTSVLITIVHYFLIGDEKYVIWGPGSLLVDIWYLVVFYSMVLPFFYIFNIPIIINAIKKCRLKRNKDSKRYTQKQAHKICEGVPMDPVKAYTDIYQIFLVCLFFSPAFPMGIGILIGSLVLVYWIQRCYLLRFHRRPEVLKSNLCLDSLIFIKIGCFVLSMGELYFDIVLRGVEYVSIILISQSIVSFCFIWIPIEDIFLSFFTYSGDEAEIKSNLTYEESKKSLDLDYVRSNPVTSTNELLRYIRLVTQMSSIKKTTLLRRKSNLRELMQNSPNRINFRDADGRIRQSIKSRVADEWELCMQRERNKLNLPADTDDKEEKNDSVGDEEKKIVKLSIGKNKNTPNDDSIPDEMNNLCMKTKPLGMKPKSPK